MDAKVGRKKEAQSLLKSPSVGTSTSKNGRGYSVTLARAVTAAVPMLYFAGLLPTVSLLPQYLVHRLTLEDGHLKHNRSNETVRGPCASADNLSAGTVETDAIQSEASDLMLYITYAQSCPALVTCLLLGGFADVFGRRPLILASVFSGFLRVLVIALTIRFDLPLWALYASGILDGFTGSWYIMFVSLFSTVADINKEQRDRVFWITVIAVCVNLVSAIFTVLVGFIIDTLGFFDASLFSVGALCISFLVALFLLPETLEPPETKTYNVFSNMHRMMGYFLLKGSTRRKLTFWIAIALFMFSVMNVVTNGSIDSLYQLHRPFCWTAFWIGLYTGLRLAGQFVLGAILLKMLQKCFKDEHIGMAGLLFQASSFALEAVITKTWQFIFVPVIGTLGSITVPVVRGVISSMASSTDQGAVFSSVAVMEVVCNVVAATGVLRVYSATVGTFAGASYLLMASFSVVAFLLFLMLLRIRDESSRGPAYEKIVEPINSEGHERDM